MRLLITVCFLVAACWQPAFAQDRPSYFRLLNSYLVLKLHLSEDPAQGKMIGAAWLRFENRTGAPVRTVPLLLNPGMRITKVMGEKKAPLPLQQEIVSLQGWQELKINAASVTLPAPVENGKIIELVVNYEGRMDSMAPSGMGYVRETLSTDFTIFRMENFSYPVIAEPTLDGFSAAGRLQNYYQSVSLELPDGYMPAGNTPITSKTLDGDRMTFELKTDVPIPSFVLPIARYGVVRNGPVTVNYLGENRAAAEALAAEAQRAIDLFSGWFGPTRDGSALTITAIPDGYGSQRMPGLIIQEADAFGDPTKYYELYHEISHLWHPPEPALRPSRWNEGLAMLLQAMAMRDLQNDPGLAAFQQARLDRVRTLFAETPDYGQVAIARYGDEGVTDLSYSVGAVFFSVLHDLMGETPFLDMIGAAQRDFARTGVDAGAFAGFMLEHMPNSKAEEFVERWFLQGEAGADVAASPDFEALVALYR